MASLVGDGLGSVDMDLRAKTQPLARATSRRR